MLLVVVVQLLSSVTKENDTKALLASVVVVVEEVPLVVVVSFRRTCCPVSKSGVSQAGTRPTYFPVVVKDRYVGKSRGLKKTTQLQASLFQKIPQRFSGMYFDDKELRGHWLTYHLFVLLNSSTPTYSYYRSFVPCKYANPNTLVRLNKDTAMQLIAISN